MEKKQLFVLVLSVGMFFGIAHARAQVEPPTFTIIINEHTVPAAGTTASPDANFSFHVVGAIPPAGQQEFSNDFDIQTAGESGTNTVSAPYIATEAFTITQDPLSGWQPATITCSSGDYAIGATLVPSNGIIFSSNPNSSVVCDFTNTQGAVAPPTFSMTVNEHAVGSDGDFRFNISQEQQVISQSSSVYAQSPAVAPDFSSNFDIQTVGGSGTNTVVADAYTGENFDITQDPLPGWQAPIIVCTSDDPQVDSYPDGNGGVFVVADAGGAVSCGFENDNATTSSESNVLFIPGFEGSRLYEKGNPLNPEDQLWEPNANSDVVDLGMNSSGVSNNSKIYTRDIIGETNLPLGNKDIYQSFENSLNAMVSANTMADWAAAPYDWRYDPTYIVSHGVVDGNGHITYEGAVPRGQTPFIISQLEALIASSKTGKVTIVTHSNGGLIVKALIEKLQAMHASGQNDDIDKIDKVIMVAAPQVGTPEAIGALLHGDGTTLGKDGFNVLDASVARDFGKNVPGAYALLPSQQYFNAVSAKAITFDPSLNSVNNFYQKYGASITTYSALKNFLLGISDNRANPASNDTTDPEVLNATLLNSANAIHTDIDNYQIPASINVYNIAGWGEPTASGVAYTTKQNCVISVLNFLCAPVLDENMIPTSDGDGIVVTPSATFGNGLKYYVDLKQYDSSVNQNYKHDQIFETTPVINLVQNILTGDSSLPQYVTTTKPSGSDNLVLSTHSPVTLDVYDSAGRHTGLSPVQSLPDFQQVDEQIPNSSYIPFGEGTYVSVPNGNNYTIAIAGTDFGTFTFEKQHYLNDQPQVDTSMFTDIPVTPTTNATLTLDAQGNPSQMQIDIDGDGTVDQTISAGSDFDPIVYLEMIRKTVLSMQLAPSVQNAIIKKINNLETLIQSGKIKNAKLKIRTLLEAVKLHHGHKKHIDTNDKQSLLDMFNQLLDNLN